MTKIHIIITFLIFFNGLAQDGKYKFAYNVTHRGLPSYYYRSCSATDTENNLMIYFLDYKGELIENGLYLQLTTSDNKVMSLKPENGLITAKVEGSIHFKFNALNFQPLEGTIEVLKDAPDTILYIVAGPAIDNIFTIKSKIEIDTQTRQKLIEDVVLGRESKLLKNKTCLVLWQI